MIQPAGKNLHLGEHCSHHTHCSYIERDQMNFVALQMLLGDRAKYLGLIFAVAFSTFLMSHQSSIFAGIMRRTTSQIMDVPDANLCLMDLNTQNFAESKSI